MAYLSAADAADFTELAQALSVPNNSLSSHLIRLENAGYVELRRGFFGRKPRTQIVLSQVGRTAWALYLNGLSSSN